MTECAECGCELWSDEVEDDLCGTCAELEECQSCGREVPYHELDGNAECDECWGEDGACL